MSAARQHSLGGTVAAILGAPVVAFLACATLIALLPASDKLRFALGAHAMVPLWVALACLLPLARSGWRAWAMCVGAAIPLALAVRWLG